MSQTTLAYDIISRAILYYVQFRPSSLSSFRWFIDQKNSKKTTYEQAFEDITPVLLQSMSLRNPMAFLQDADYSFMKDYVYERGKEPDYLKTEYGIDVNLDRPLNIGKILRKNITFEDSKDSPGVQIADILASTSRRLLRNQFKNNELVAQLLGKMMLSNKKNEYPIQLISFIDDVIENKQTTRSIGIIDKNSKPMVSN